MADGIIGMSALRARLAKMETSLGTTGMNEPLLKVGIVALKASAERIDAGGPGWPPNKAGTPILHRTGNLLRSLTAGGAGDILTVSGYTVEAGTNVTYAGFLQRGTSRMLARRFLYIDEQVATKVRDIFAGWLMTGETNG